MGAASILRPALFATLAAAVLLTRSGSTCAELGAGCASRRSLLRFAAGAAAGGTTAGLSGAAPPAAEPAAAGPEACQATVQSFLDGRPISLDRISLTYSRGSEGPPTQGELEAAVADLASAGLPPAT